MRRSGIQRLVDVRVAGCGGDEPYLQYAAQRVAFHAQLCTHCRYAADAHGLLQHCGNVLGVQTVWELAQRLGYTGPIELLSMWLCLLGGGTLCTPAAWDLLSSPRAPALACPAGQYIGGGRRCFAQGVGIWLIVWFAFLPVRHQRCAYLHLKKVAPHPATLLHILARLAGTCQARP